MEHFLATIAAGALANAHDALLCRTEPPTGAEAFRAYRAEVAALKAAAEAAAEAAGGRRVAYVEPLSLPPIGR